MNRLNRIFTTNRSNCFGSCGVSRVTLRRNGCCSPVWTGYSPRRNAAPTGSTSVGGRIITTNCRLRLRPPRRAASVRRPQVPSGRQDGLFLRYLRVHPLVQRPPAVEYRSRGRDDGSRRAVDRQEQADLRRQRQFGAAEPRQGSPFHLPAGRHSVPEEVGQGDFPAGDHAASPPRTFHAHVFRFECCDAGISTPRPEYPRSGPNPIFRCTTT